MVCDSGRQLANRWIGGNVISQECYTPKPLRLAPAEPSQKMRNERENKEKEKKIMAWQLAGWALLLSQSGSSTFGKDGGEGKCGGRGQRRRPALVP